MLGYSDIARSFKRSESWAHSILKVMNVRPAKVETGTVSIKHLYASSTITDIKKFLKAHPRLQGWPKGRPRTAPSKSKGARKQ